MHEEEEEEEEGEKIEKEDAYYDILLQWIRYVQITRILLYIEINNIFQSSLRHNTKINL